MEKCQKERRSATREQEVKFRPKSQGRIWPSEERGHSRPPHVGPGRILGGSSEGPGRVLGRGGPCGGEGEREGGRLAPLSCGFEEVTRETRGVDINNCGREGEMGPSENQICRLRGWKARG